MAQIKMEAAILGRFLMVATIRWLWKHGNGILGQCSDHYGSMVPARSIVLLRRICSCIFPEPVCKVFLQCHISLSEYNKLQGSSSTRLYGTSSSLDNFPPLKLGILFMPHDSVEDLKPANAVESYAVEAREGACKCSSSPTGRDTAAQGDRLPLPQCWGCTGNPNMAVHT